MITRFIEVNDGEQKIIVNINHIKMFYYDEEYDVTVLILGDDYELRVNNSYEEIARKINQAFLQ